ncbi:hypothetical protein NP233_g8527 [Leucocoprinus birnbaumii]|uniref:Uncharacterized protein n=1 Tax=Leucocoprinus birnbaumii TaxID=56174 RepID=A0AAD5VQR5_9AGAR|nr:hypothetical protein NP233_g8527 [Leucocoprinus birnbaumii]
MNGIKYGLAFHRSTLNTEKFAAFSSSMKALALFAVSLGSVIHLYATPLPDDGSMRNTGHQDHGYTTSNSVTSRDQIGHGTLNCSELLENTGKFGTAVGVVGVPASTESEWYGLAGEGGEVREEDAATTPGFVYTTGLEEEEVVLYDQGVCSVDREGGAAKAICLSKVVDIGGLSRRGPRRPGEAGGPSSLALKLPLLEAGTGRSACFAGLVSHIEPIREWIQYRAGPQEL